MRTNICRIKRKGWLALWGLALLAGISTPCYGGDVSDVVSGDMVGTPRPQYAEFDIGALEYSVDAPAGFAISSVAASGDNYQATLDWGENAHPDFTHFIVYWGTASGTYTENSGNIGAARTYSLTVPKNQVTYCSVRAFDDQGRVSAYAPEKIIGVPEIKETNPKNGAGVAPDTTRVASNTAFGVRIGSLAGLNVDSASGEFDAADIALTIDDGTNTYTRNLGHTAVVRTVIVSGSAATATDVWAVYDRSKESGAIDAAVSGDYAYGATVEIGVDATDRFDISMARATRSFGVETEAAHNAAASASPATAAAAAGDLDATHNAGIQVTSGDLQGAKILYNNAEAVAPTLGPSDELPAFDVSGTDAVGVAMNLQPPMVFSTPVRLFIPCPGKTDVSGLSVYYHNGTAWVLACDAAGTVQSDGQGWMVAGSRVNHNSDSPPTVEIKVNHFSGAIAGGAATSGGGSTPVAAASGSSNCFIATAAFGSPMERQVLILKRFRDVFLTTSGPGRKLVRFYYRHSPQLATMISRSERLKSLVRTALMPVVAIGWTTLKLGKAGTLCLLIGLVLLFVLALRWLRGIGGRSVAGA